jgi:hypothetical protein
MIDRTFGRTHTVEVFFVLVNRHYGWWSRNFCEQSRASASSERPHSHLRAERTLKKVVQPWKLSIPPRYRVRGASEGSNVNGKHQDRRRNSLPTRELTEGWGKHTHRVVASIYSSSACLNNWWRDGVYGTSKCAALEASHLLCGNKLHLFCTFFMNWKFDIALLIVKFSM